MSDDDRAVPDGADDRTVSNGADDRTVSNGADDRAWDGELLDITDDELTAALEALLLVVDTPAPTEQLATAIGVTTARAEGSLRRLAQELTARGSGIDLRFAGDGWRFYTRRDFAPYVEKLLSLEPNFTVEQFGRTYPFQRDEDRERYLRGLELAGIPLS